jgi:hypothetical protein
MKGDPMTAHQNSSRNRPARPVALLLPCIVIALLACACQKEREDRECSPRGGTLVEIGDQLAFLDVLLDPGTGRLTIHVLDGSAAQPIRLAQSKIKMTIVLPPLDDETTGHIINVTLDAVENAATGQTVGNTSVFSAELPRLVGHDHFAAVVGELEIQGTMVTGLNVLYAGDAPE